MIRELTNAATHKRADTRSKANEPSLSPERRIIKAVKRINGTYSESFLTSERLIREGVFISRLVAIKKARAVAKDRLRETRAAAEPGKKELNAKAADTAVQTLKRMVMEPPNRKLV